jgi:hypothetical protein
MNPTVAQVLASTTEVQSNSGISVQGIITLALIVAAVLAVNRKKISEWRKEHKKIRAEKAKEKAANEKKENAPSGDPGPQHSVPNAVPADLTPYVQAPEGTPVPPPMPSAPPSFEKEEAQNAPESLPEPSWAPVPKHPVASASGGLRGIPDAMKAKLYPAQWESMCRERRLNGLTFLRVSETPYGIDVHVEFNKDTNLKYVSSNLFQIETGLDIPNDWKVQVKPGDSARKGIIRIITHDPLSELIYWEPSPTPVRLADLLWISRTPFGEDVRISVKQRIGLFGTSGSGKSCAQRLIGSHVIQAIDADLEIWDLKFGTESQHYEGKATRITNTSDAAERVRWLIEEEYPRRAAIMIQKRISDWEETSTDRARVIIIDEGNVITRQFKPEQMKLLYQAIEQGRALGVFFTWATQFPKADNLPTEIRSQLNCRISMLLLSSEESGVVYKDDVSKGWAPHNLIGPGWMLIKDVNNREPIESKARWLSEDEFPNVPLSGIVSEPVLAVRPDVSDNGPAEETPVRPSVREDIWGVLAMSPEPLGVSEISRLTGRSKAAVSDTLRAMETAGEVCRTGTDTRPTFCLPLSEES